MLTYLLFMTRIYLLNFGSMWKLPVLAFAVMLLFRLLWGGKQPCKGLLFIMPAAYVAVSLYNAAVFAAGVSGGLTPLGGVEAALLFGWLGLLLGAVIDTLLRQMKRAAHA